MASEGLHEPAELLGESTIDYHRAVTSLIEEFEAVDWYNQRVAATGDDTLAAVLAHNRDEEKEHAMMTLEWLRRHDATLDQHMRTYLFTSAPITEVEAEAEAEGSLHARGAGASETAADDVGTMRIGSLRNTPGAEQAT